MLNALGCKIAYYIQCAVITKLVYDHDVTFDLEVPGRHVQRQAVATHKVHGLVSGHHLASLGDHNPQLYLVVKVVTANGDFNLLPSLNLLININKAVKFQSINVMNVWLFLKLGIIY